MPRATFVAAIEVFATGGARSLFGGLPIRLARFIAIVPRALPRTRACPGTVFTAAIIGVPTLGAAVSFGRGVHRRICFLLGSCCLIELPMPLTRSKAVFLRAVVREDRVRNARVCPGTVGTAAVSIVPTLRAAIFSCRFLGISCCFLESRFFLVICCLLLPKRLARSKAVFPRALLRALASPGTACTAAVGILATIEIRASIRCDASRGSQFSGLVQQRAFVSLATDGQEAGLEGRGCRVRRGKRDERDERHAPPHMAAQEASDTTRAQRRQPRRAINKKANEHEIRGLSYLSYRRTEMISLIRREFCRRTEVFVRRALVALNK